jgi:hypothetical protein
MNRAALSIAASIAVFILAAVLPAHAQYEAGAEDGFSAYSVARVKVLDGSVWVRPSDGGDWQEFSSNSPVPPGSRVSVPDGSEAELQFHGGQFVLLTSGTDLEVRDLREGISVFRLRAGEIRFDLPADEFAPVSVRLPGGAVAEFPVPGRQWLTVMDSDETRLVVRRGRAVVLVDGDEHRLGAGDEAMIGREVTVGRYQGGADEYAEAPPPPEAEALGDAPPVVVGELRQYGEWVDLPTYGYVWRPRVAVGWSPYVYGHWVWISPYGWTWVSYEPWGWYPYRCGYWLTDPVFGWVWSPYNAFVSVNFVFGSHRYRHHNVIFRPATVRFIPEGGNVRWAPLRPGERFRPARFARGDSRLERWNRPLDTGRVFVRAGSDRGEWRDWSAVRAERQVEIRRTRAARSRPDTRTVRPERGAVRPSARQPAARPAQREGQRIGTPREAVPRPVKVERQAPVPRRDPAARPAQREGQRIGTPREAVPRPAKVERQAPAPRRDPAARPAQREGQRIGTPREAAPRPVKVEQRAPAPRSVPATRPPARENIREVQPKEDRSGGPPKAAPEARRGIVQERPPASRSPNAGTRGQETRGDRGDGRWDDRGYGGRGGRGR